MAQTQPTADDVRLLKVRDLLFGDDLSRIDTEFRKRDQELAKQLHVLADRLEQRVEDLDASSRQCRDELSGEFRQALETTKAENEAAHARLDARLDDLQKATGEAIQELRDGLAALRSEVNETRDLLSTSLRDSVDDLRRRSVARTDLAETLGALARAMTDPAPDPAT